jgi:hypothetical protein
VTIFARLLSSLALGRAASARGRTLGLALAASVWAVLLVAAAPAGALVTEVETSPGKFVTAGVSPRISDNYLEGGSPASYENPSGDPVLHGTGVYAVYWDPDDEYWSEWQNAIDGYFHNAGAASGSLESVFAVDAQYTDKSNLPASYAQTFKGAYTYTHAYPVSGCVDTNPFTSRDRIPREHGGTPTAVCLTSTQVAAALESFIAQSHLPKGLGNVYYVLTPPGVTMCLDGGGATGHCSDFDGTIKEVEQEEVTQAEKKQKKESFTPGEPLATYENSLCSYHAAINPDGLATGDANTIAYAVIPWTAGGYGDNKLEESDRRPGWDCQDGGFNPAGKHGGEEYEEEKAERNKAEEEEFNKKDLEEKEEVELARNLEGPHEEEPNQQECPSTAGTCDYGLSDLIINQISLQQQDMVTDPLLNAWQDSHHYENTDECRFVYGLVLGGGVAGNTETLGGTLFNQALSEGVYYLNDAFNLAAYRLPYPGVPCLTHANLDPKFTSPNPVNAGETVAFDGMESDIALDASIAYSASGTPEPNYATYTWNFGDGTSEVSGYAPGAPVCEAPWLSPCAASVFHSYQYGGTYTVTLTVKDVAGDTASVTNQVTVVGPPPPSPPEGPAGPASPPGNTTSSSGTPAGSSPSSAPAGVPAPVAAAMIVPQSLHNALHKGLVVRYSVNEQVAGRFEVLLSRATARRLGISGSPATGLPAGSAPELVIAKAILVTTKGGHSSVHIVFSKRTAARLAHAHKVALMLRLIVRNASSASPTTTTVISSATLG